MSSRLPQKITLATGNLVGSCKLTGPSQVKVTGTFGSVVLGSTTDPALAEKTITEDERFKSEMKDMAFTLTGTGPVVVLVTPLEKHSFKITVPASEWEQQP